MAPSNTSAAEVEIDIPHVDLAPGLRIPRMVVGLWQVADMEREGGVGLDAGSAVRALEAARQNGFDTFDMADHYGSAELLMAQLRTCAKGNFKAFTKWCPKPGRDAASPEAIDAAVQLSMKRMGTDTIDLLQLHTWDYLDGPGNYLKQLKHLDTHPHVKAIGLTNFDAAHLRLALAEGINVVSNQICFSLLDSRAAAGSMLALCHAKGSKFWLLESLPAACLPDRWLGKPEPTQAQLEASWSLSKYRRFIECFGGWSRFQELLFCPSRSC